MRTGTVVPELVLRKGNYKIMTIFLIAPHYR
jgi:hypothetical protein